MSEKWTSQTDGSAQPMFWIGGAMLAAGGLFFLALYWLAQPTFYENPGLAAFTPPPATPLVPLAGPRDAPALAQIPSQPPSALTALAQAQSTEKPASEKPIKPVSHQAAHKHEPAAPHQINQPQWGYAQQNYEYRDWNSDRARAGGKNWF
jgi:hypothetical protein